MNYTYLIGWSNLNTWYYGARWSSKAKPEDLWKTYFTSSKKVKEFTKINGNPDIIQIRKIFKNQILCRQWEIKVLQKMKVKNSDTWLNINDKASPPDLSGRILTEQHKNKLRYKRSKETKKKMSLSHAGKKHSDESKTKMSVLKKGSIPWNKGVKNCFKEESNQKRSKSLSGRKLSKDRIEKMKIYCKPPSQKGSIWITNGFISKLIKKDELNNWALKGFYKGRTIN